MIDVSGSNQNVTGSHVLKGFIHNGKVIVLGFDYHFISKMYSMVPGFCNYQD